MCTHLVELWDARIQIQNIEIQKIWNRKPIWSARPPFGWVMRCKLCASFNPQLFPVCNLPIVITKHFFNRPQVYLSFCTQNKHRLNRWFTNIEIEKRYTQKNTSLPIVITLHFFNRPPQVYLPFCRQNKHVHSIVDPREFVCHRLMNLGRESNLLNINPK